MSNCIMDWFTLNYLEQISIISIHNSQNDPIDVDLKFVLQIVTKVTNNRNTYMKH